MMATHTNLQVQDKTALRSATSFTPVRSGLLQRKCACGGSPGVDRECAECRSKRLALQRQSAGQAGLSTVPPIVYDVLRFPGQALDPDTWALMEPHPNHDFKRVSLVTAVPKMMQAKLPIGRPGDKYEQEADRVAEQVMRTPEPQSLKEAKISGQVQSLHLQRLCPKCAEEEEKNLQAKAIPGQVPEATTELETKPGIIKGGGQPLSAPVCTFFESRFGHDFSQVRVHTGTKAAQSARAVNALAYTVGQDVVFGVGQYAPGIKEGRRLLAHELTHVVQQGHAPPLEGKRRNGVFADESMLIQVHDTNPGIRRTVAVPQTKAELHIAQEPLAILKVQNLFGKWWVSSRY